jgi:HNH endonuclease
MTVPSKLINVPTSEQYAQAFSAIEKFIKGEPHERLLRVLHSATGYRTRDELASEVLPNGGPTAGSMVDGRFKSLGKLIREAMPDHTQWEIRPTLPRNKPAFWATITSCYMDQGIFRYQLLPQVAEALERLEWVPPRIPKPAPPSIDQSLFDSEREKRLQEIRVRRGQKPFRDVLIKAYGSRCAITGCDAVKALEAAHIVPFADAELDIVSNGLLLRADIHTLFDLDLIGIEPHSLTIRLSAALQNTSYTTLQDRKLSLPVDGAMHPSTDGIARRWASFSERCRRLN